MMGFHAPEMPIHVDDDTGVWTTDALPMLYVLGISLSITT